MRCVLWRFAIAFSLCMSAVKCSDTAPTGPDNGTTPQCVLDPYACIRFTTGERVQLPFFGNALNAGYGFPIRVPAPGMLEAELSNVFVTDPGRMYFVLSRDSENGNSFLCGEHGPVTELGDPVCLGEAHRVLDDRVSTTYRIDFSVPPGPGMYSVGMHVLSNHSSGGGTLRMWYTPR